MSDAAQPQSSEGGAPEWMVSYADMITIIMAFFVVLYATASGSGKNDKGHENAKKAESGRGSGGGNNMVGNPQADADGQSADPQLQKVFDSLSNRFGPKWTVANCWTGGSVALDKSSGQAGRSDGEKRRGKLLRGTSGEHGDATTPPQPGQYVAPGGRVCFDDSSASLSNEQKRKLHLLADELAGRWQRLEIRGHTSRVPLPPDSPFRDHRDLAYARCRAVEEYLVAAGIDPRRIRLGVAGDNEPLQAKDDPTRAKQDSRVEIHLLNEWIPQEAGTH